MCELDRNICENVLKREVEGMTKKEEYRFLFVKVLGEGVMENVVRD